MAFIKLKSRIYVLVVLTVISLLLLVPSQSYTEPKYGEEEESAEEALFNCFMTCGPRRHNNQWQPELTECEKRCVAEYQERKKRQEQEHGGSGGGSTEYYNHHEPLKRYKECQMQCGRLQPGEQRQYCQQKCQWEYERQQRERGQEHGQERDAFTNPGTEWGEEQGTETRTENPYFSESQRFSSKYETEEGHIKVLERFNKRSPLLQGIENWRLAVLEANPNTFVVPHHIDAESVFVVVRGKGTVSYVWQNERQSFKVERGDVLRIPAGSLVYLANTDDNERLYVLKLLQPVNTPGRFKNYFGVGGENPESFYRTFSNEILEAAFNIPKERLERLFGTKQGGVIIRGSKEQIRALSKESKPSSKGKKGEESWNPFNLLEKRPLFSSKHGEFFEASPNDYKQLRDLDVSVAFMNINKGGMVGPYYNSKSTKLVFVVGGSGYFEMACPHIKAAQSGQGSFQGRKERIGEATRTGVHYQRVSARLSVGDAFVIPAGHPIAIVSSKDSNLQLAGFGIKAWHNQKNFLSGRENLWNQVQPEAKELSFQVPAREVEEILKSQDQSYFLPGPGQREERMERRVASILDFVGF